MTKTMKVEIVLNADEVRELKEEIIKLYKLTHDGNKPSEKWVIRSIEKMLNASHC